MLSAGLITSIAPWYIMFVFFWWITGTMAIACYTAAFVWTMELTTGKWKIYLGMAMNYSWPTCRLIIAGLTYSIREWRWVMRAISGFVAFGSVILFWLPESPRWLIAKGRIPEAQKILAECRKFNGNPIAEEKIELRKPAQSGAAGSFWDIFKHPILRIQVVIMYFNWFTTALIMYGLALSWKELTGGLYLNFVIGTILDFPAKTLAMIFVLKTGRKYPYMVGSAITGTMFLITIFIPRNHFAGNWPIVVLALTGNFCTTMCFAILYMYTGELMPTTVRAAGVGSSSLVSKIGGVLGTTVAALASVHIAIPNILFASLALTSAALTFLLPETKGRPMPETLDDVDRTRFFERREKK
jgi:MFS family permease